MHRPLVRAGFILVLLALLTGLAVPQFANPRLGLAAHTVGLFGGLFLVVLGVVAPAFVLGDRSATVLRWCWSYAAYANWLAGVTAAATGASRFTPLAGSATKGGPVAEAVVAFLLLSLSLAAIGGTTLALWGLRRPPAATLEGAPPSDGGMQRRSVGRYLVATTVVLLVGFLTVQMLRGPVHAVRDAKGCALAYAEARTRADSMSVDFMSFRDSLHPRVRQRCGMLQATHTVPR